MLLVTLTEARERLPELVDLVAAGEKVVIGDHGKWVAALTPPPPMPPTLQQEAASRVIVKEAVKEMARGLIEGGVDIPEDSELGKLLREEA